MFILTGRYPYPGDNNYSSTSKKMLLIKWVSGNRIWGKKYSLALYLFTLLKDRCFIWMPGVSPGKQKVFLEGNFLSFLASPCHAANSPKSFQCHHYFVAIFTFLKRKSCIVLKYTRLWVKQCICKINVTLQLPQHYWNTLYCLITTKLIKF